MRPVGVGGSGRGDEQHWSWIFRRRSDDMDATTKAMLDASTRQEVDEDDDTMAKDDVLSRHCNWESYLTARLVDTHDLQLLRKYDKKSSAVRKSMLMQV